MSGDTLLPLKTAAQFAGVSPEYLKKLRLEGRPPEAIKLDDGRIAYKIRELRTFASNRRPVGRPRGASK